MKGGIDLDLGTVAARIQAGNLDDFAMHARLEVFFPEIFTQLTATRSKSACASFRASTFMKDKLSVRLALSDNATGGPAGDLPEGQAQE